MGKKEKDKKSNFVRSETNPEGQNRAIRASYARRRAREWERAHEFSKRKDTKSTKGHPVYVFAKKGDNRQFLAFTHSPTTNGKDNVKLLKNIDGSNDDCYVRPVHLVDKKDMFVEPTISYDFRCKEDYDLVMNIIHKK